MPKGVILYEATRWLPWAIRMKRFPVGPHRETRFAYGQHQRQYILRVQPESDNSQPNPVIVYIHGGGWQFGTPEMFRPNALALMEAGFSVFMLSHRRIPVFGITELREDLVNGLLKIREVMEKEGSGNRKIILGGVSSGGNLAALLAFDPVLRTAAGWKKDLPAGIFLIAAPLNLRGMWHSPPLWFLAGKRNGAQFRLANPIDHLETCENIPTLIIHGTHDGLVKYRSVQDFYEKMKATGAAETEFVTLDRGTHLDAASWCFPDHRSNKTLMNWLAKIDGEAV